MTEAGNTVGGYVAQAIPAVGKGANAQQMFAQPRKAYVLLNVEPELDSFNPQVARSALNQAEMVVVLSAYKHATDYADVLLPIAPFTETSGTFVNCEGRAQSFNGTVRPLADARPAWKVLRVLGNLLGLPGFDYDTSEAIRAEVLGTNNLAEANLTGLLNNLSDTPLQAASQGDDGSAIERVADVPIYFSDAIVRRAPSLQDTTDGQPPQAWLSAALAEKLGIATGDLVNVKQGQGVASLMAAIDLGLPSNVVRIAAAHPATKALGAMFGSIAVEKA